MRRDLRPAAAHRLLLRGRSTAPAGARRRRLALAALAVALAVGQPAPGAAPAIAADEAAGPGVPGVPRPQTAPKAGGPVLPRFASLKADEVNVRVGPGVRYPIEWVYKRKDLPVEIVDEYENWRRVRDIEGAEGWVHRSMLQGRRSVIVIGRVRALRRAAEFDAPTLARAEPGVVGRLDSCDGLWCRIEIAGLEGWMPRAALWGVYPGEELD